MTKQNKLRIPSKTRIIDMFPTILCVYGAFSRTVSPSYSMFGSIIKGSK